jgi:hypothetical protein
VCRGQLDGIIDERVFRKAAIQAPADSMDGMLLLRLLFFIHVLTFFGCALKPADFARSAPSFDIQAFYTGHTRSTGVIENRAGEPLQRVATETWGRMKNGQLELTQDIRMGENKPQRRVWLIRRVNARHFEATTSSVVGTARGESAGNAFRFSYLLALQPGNPLSWVRMTHWMYLQPDGRTMLNRVAVRKAGFLVAQISEIFHRDGRAAIHGGAMGLK